MSITSSSSVITGYPPPPAPPLTTPYASYSYTRVFQPRLLGFTGPIDTPVTVTSYSPDTGLANTIWTLPGSSEVYIDPACVVVSIAGQYDAAGDRSLSWGVHYGPGSVRNRSGRIPPKKGQKTRTRLHAELHAAAKALEQLKALVADDLLPEIRNIVVVTDSRRIVHGVSACVVTWQQNQWTRAGGRKPVPNASTWKSIIAAIQDLETKGVGVRFWAVSEDGNQDALRLTAEAAAHAAKRVGGHSRPAPAAAATYGNPGLGFSIPGYMSPASSASASTFGEHHGQDPPVPVNSPYFHPAYTALRVDNNAYLNGYENTNYWWPGWY